MNEIHRARHPIAPNHGGTREKALEQLRAIVDEGIYRVFCISPSYGATAFALVKEVTIVEGAAMPR
jgi:hypothetical protein